MKRRTLLRGLAQGSALGLAGLAAPAALATEARKQAFAAALADNPWLLGYANASQEAFDASDIRFSGKLPAGLEGVLYRNGAARHEAPGYRYGHWFDGDGMIQRYAIANGKLTHRGRFVATRKLTREQAAGRPLYQGFDSVPPNPAAVEGPDDVNSANISVLPHNDRLFALWEAGSPYELDPVTLETKGLHAFSDETQGVPFSAHPRVDPQGNIWNFGYFSSGNVVILWHVGPDGALKKTGLVPVDPISMPHDFVVTERYIVLLMPPLHYRPSGKVGFLNQHQWTPDDPTRALVIDKNDFSLTKTLELPAQWVFHFGNGYDNASRAGANTIVFDAARADDPTVMFDTFRKVMSGTWSEDVHASHTRYTLNLSTGTATEEALLDDSMSTEFPTIDPRVNTGRYRRVTVLARDAAKPAAHDQLDSVAMLDVETGALQRYQYPDNELPEEHLFVPKPGSRVETEGWVLGTTLDVKARQTRLNVFDASAVDAGPVATAALPYALPLGLHGKFVAEQHK